MNLAPPLVLALSLAACAHAPAHGLSPAPAPAPAPAPPPAPTDPLPSLDALSARAPSLAPGMREIARRESPAGANAVAIARADAADLCVRIAFVADAPVAVTLGDDAPSSPATEGALPAHGPACIRKGATLAATFVSASPARVRWIAWGSP